MDHNQGAPLAPEVREQVLAWGRGAVAPTPRCTLPDFVAVAVRRQPAALAVVDATESLTYAELSTAAARLAGRLSRVGAGPGSTVGVCVGRSAQMVAVLLGVLETGAAYLPLDPGLPTERTRSLLSNASPIACVVDDSTTALVPDGPWQLLHAARGDAEPAGALPGAMAPSRPSSADLAYVLFTSGSTGRPKGVCVEHRSVVDFVVHHTVAYAIGPDCRMLALASLGFDVSVAEIFPALSAGATLVVGGDEERQSPDRLAELLRRERVTHAELPPGLLALLDPADLPDLRLVSVGGESPSARQVARWAAAGIRVINAYGPTEATVTATLMECTAEERATVPIGRPMPNTRVYLVDELGRLVPPGCPGEIWIAGPGVARGYLGAPELTAERFGDDPFSPTAGERVYRSGDLAAWNPDGTLEFLGRVDAQLNLHGFRIEPGEVEARLRAHPDVADAAVTVRDDGSGGQLVAYVSPERAGAGGDVDRRQLGRWCATALPAFMVPAAFVPLAALPLTLTGKVDRAALAALPASVVADAEPRPVVPPRTDRERTILEVWRKLMPDAMPFGVEDDFFDLGGHSLLAMRLLSRLRRDFAVALTPADLAGATTVAALARLVAEHQKGAPALGSTALPRRLSNPPPSFAQQRLWFAERLHPGQPTYHLPVALRLHGRLDVDALTCALALVAARHDALRTSFADAAGEPQVRVAPAVELPLDRVDLRHLPAGQREAKLRELLDSAIRAQFRLDDGPLWRACVIRLADEEHAFLLVVHHAVADGWSLSILLDEVAAGYVGGPAALPESPLQYGDFAAWQRDQVAVESSGALAYWTRTLAGAPAALALPADRPRPSVQTFRAAHAGACLPTELANAVKAFAARRRVSLFSALLAPFSLLLGRLAATGDVVVSCPVAGRTEPELEGVVGLLVDAVPVRLSLPNGDSTAGALVDRVAAAVLAAQEHAHLPFDLLVEALRPPRDPGRSPIAQLGFNLLNYPPERLPLPGVRAEEIPLDPPGSLLDLTLYVRETVDGLALDAVYNPDLFDSARIEALLDSYVGLVRQVVADPTAPTSALSVLTAAARRRLPNPTAPLPRDTGPSVLDRFGHQVARRGERLAVDGADASYTYRELDRASNAVAAGLGAAGIGAGDVVMVLATRSPRLPVALLAGLKAGATVHLVDAGHPGRRLSAAAAAAHAAGWLAVDDAPPPLGPAADPTAPSLTNVAALLATPTPAYVPDRAARLDDPAFLLSTSGSSGAAKAVLSTGRPLAHFVEWYAAEFDLCATDRFALTSGVAHDPVLRDLLVPLSLGATVCVPPPEVHRAADRLVGWLHDRRITVLHATPQLCRLLTRAARSTGRDLYELRLVTCSGDVLRGEDAPALAALAPNARVISGYGATETPQLAGWQPAADDRHRERVSLGHGIPGTQLLVLTGSGELAGVGELGEIVVRSPFLAAGYVGDSPASGDHFYRDRTGCTRYRTGDLGRFLPDGRVEFAGRRDGQVKVRGFRVETGEVLAALRRCAEVADAVVVAEPDGDGDTRLVAYTVGRPLDTSEERATDVVRRQLRARLPEPAVPAAVVWVDALPSNHNGKADMAALPHPRAPLRGAPDRVLPGNPVERWIADVWRAVLGLGDVGVGVDDNFFDVGGSSLRLVDVQTRLEALLARPVPIVDLFQYPTICSLAAHLSTGGGVTAADADSAVRRIEARLERRRRPVATRDVRIS